MRILRESALKRGDMRQVIELTNALARLADENRALRWYETKGKGVNRWS